MNRQLSAELIGLATPGWSVEISDYSPDCELDGLAQEIGFLGPA